MSDDLRRAKKAYLQEPTTENYLAVQRWQLRTRLETPWPCDGTHGNGDMLPGHDLVDVPEGDELYLEVFPDGIPFDIHLRCCTRCGGVKRIKKLRRPDPDNPFFQNVLRNL